MLLFLFFVVGFLGVVVVVVLGGYLLEIYRLLVPLSYPNWDALSSVALQRSLKFD